MCFVLRKETLCCQRKQAEFGCTEFGATDGRISSSRLTLSSAFWFQGKRKGISRSGGDSIQGRGLACGAKEFDAQEQRGWWAAMVGIERGRQPARSSGLGNEKKDETRWIAFRPPTNARVGMTGRPELVFSPQRNP
ncbi:predicted protein [Coccidioides posadasii str. Silveira]|uniref:Predicted protein n=1 Tax=Coccidioides posadasii (strain RMSCC 757 / Silveira) TaxID=443226 RepID=E9DE29_COCPS|nr:predicted protein [Coccidioides posadasii str. Silveira]